MFRLFKDVQKRGGHERVTREKDWEEVAAGLGFSSMGEAVHEAYVRYLSDFEAANSGRGIEGGYSPVVYQERPSVEADLRVGTTLWHYMDEDGEVGRCYAGTVKAIRPNNQCVVEYDRAEREIPAMFSSSTRAGDGRLSARMAGIEGWADALQDSEEVEAFRVTLPRSQLSTLVLNGRSPAAAKLAAHGVVCEVCSIASASNATLAVCVSCDSAYHLGCVEPALPRVPLYDWFCGDCAKDGHTAEALAQGIWASCTLPSSSTPSADAKDSATGNRPNSSNSNKDPDCEIGSQQKEIQQQCRAEISAKEGGEKKSGRKAAKSGDDCAADSGVGAWTEGGGTSLEDVEGSRESRQDSGSGCDTRSGPASRMRGVSSMKGRALKYGFGNGGHFTLKEFALMADGWRSSYLARRGLGDDATEEEMEAEFWKLVGPDPPEEDVKVLYGSDLDTGAVGSGFPWSRGGVTGDGHAAAAEPHSKRRRAWCGNTEGADYEEYSYEDDTWNLNCLPTADGSLLQFLGTHIQGVMVPWLYVGMAFSAFCWHNEDHYLYSINYLHAGSPKRWYGVPGSMAGQFETAVQQLFPELFEAHPDLLMQLVTMAHPSELTKRGVPVASTTQREGEFVLTFPQAYHAGFNMGTNCAEAVNFAPPDWLPWGKAAQERYRLHRRKPVFSHEGLVLSLVDLLTKQSREGVHTSGELYRFLRDEVEMLAMAQEEEMAAARRLGCTRFEPMEKLAESLRGFNNRPITSFKTATLSTGTATSGTLGYSGGSRRRSGDSCGHAHQSHGNYSYHGDDGVLTAIESASPVQGPQCTVCHQYCFLVVAVCDTCHSAAASGRRGSRSGSGSFRRFACGRHLEQLCACPCSSYTVYVRKDAAALRAASSGLSSLYNYLEVWEDEARGIIAAVNSGADADADPAREAAENIECAGDNKLVGGVRVKGEDASEEGSETLTSADTSSSKSLVAPKTERKDHPSAVGEGGKLSRSQISRRHTAPAMPPSPGKGEGFRSTLLSPRWHERPTLGYVKELIGVGAEMGGSEVLLADLAALVDGCTRWTKTVRVLVGREKSLRRVVITNGTATAGGVGSGHNGGVGEGQSCSAAESKAKKREPAAFHKVASLLKREARLPARPVELTEELCSLILGACDLRKQVRLVLGLGEDESILRITALCSDLQKASKAAKRPSVKSRCLILKPIGGEGDDSCGDGVGNTINCSAGSLPLAPGESTCSVEGTINGNGTTSGALGLSPMRSSSASANGVGGVGAHASRPIGKSPSADQPQPTGATAAGGGLAAGVGVVGVAAGASGNSASAGVSTGPTGRTRTRTNVSIPTGTLAAERGTWKGQAWRLWPVHQATAIALVESCLSSTVSVPELAPLREGLAALARRDNRSQVKVTSVTLKLPPDPKESSSGSGPAPGSKRGGGGVCSGSGGKARRVHEKSDGGGKKGSVGGADQMQQSKKAKALGYAQAGPSRAGVASGGRVLLGVGMVKNKRRRQDAVV